MFVCFNCCRQRESIADVGIRNQTKLRGTLQQSWSGNKRSDKIETERYFEAEYELRKELFLYFICCRQQDSSADEGIRNQLRGTLQQS